MDVARGVVWHPFVRLRCPWEGWHEMSIYMYGAIIVVVLLILLLLVLVSRKRRAASPGAGKQAPPPPAAASRKRRGQAEAVVPQAPASPAQTVSASAGDSTSLWDETPKNLRESAAKPPFLTEAPLETASQVETGPVSEELSTPEPEPEPEPATAATTQLPADLEEVATVWDNPATPEATSAESAPAVEAWPEPVAEAPATDEPTFDEAHPAVLAAVAAASTAPPVIVSLIGLRDRHTPHDDPLRAVIEDILRGWGDLTEDDTKRLEVFRPEKVLAVAESTGIPKDAKGSEYARKRLTQIRQYAAGQQIKTKIPGPNEYPDHDTVASTPAVDGQLASQPGGYPAAGGAQTDTTTAAATGTASAAGTAAAAAALGVEMANEPDHDVSPSPWGAATTSAGAPVDTQASKAAQVSVTPEPQPSREEGGFGSMTMAIKTADDIMALPPVERPDYVVFLRPPELAKLFARTDDQRLKKSVIDILENVGSPASLEVLRTCLDDPDPEIQVYALEAADRLLGT